MKSMKESVPNGAAKLPVHFEITLPQDTPEFMAPAYFGCLQWALKTDGILEEFRKDSGLAIPAARASIEKMIDEATGFDAMEHFMRAFVPWFNVWVWGPMDGPGEN